MKNVDIIIVAFKDFKKAVAILEKAGIEVATPTSRVAYEKEG